MNFYISRNARDKFIAPEKNEKNLAHQAREDGLPKPAVSDKSYQGAKRGIGTPKLYPILISVYEDPDYSNCLGQLNLCANHKIDLRRPDNSGDLRLYSAWMSLKEIKFLIGLDNMGEKTLIHRHQRDFPCALIYTLNSVYGFYTKNINT